jgi:hypothetical protein
MFQKMPAARMNNRQNSSTEQLIATARADRPKRASLEAISHFPSYLRLFDNFFAPLISELRWRASRLSTSCRGKFPAAQAHVAFL